MKVFVTGASGWIGSAVTKELLARGHRVLGMTRSDGGAACLKEMGAEVHRCSLTDPEGLKAGAKASDGVIHLAFGLDFSKFEQLCQEDRDAITAMASVLEGTNKPLVITEGTLMFPLGQLATEDTAPHTEGIGALRGASETLALSYASKGVRVSSVRLPPTNHGEGDPGFISFLTSKAKEAGVSTYVGDGNNVWPAVNRSDSAKVFALALEKGQAGSKYNAVAEQGIPTKTLATAIGKALGVPVASKTMEEAGAQLGFIGHAFAMDNPVSSEKTREQLGWEPEQQSLVADIESGLYNNAVSKLP